MTVLVLCGWGDVKAAGICRKLSGTKNFRHSSELCTHKQHQMCRGSNSPCRPYLDRKRRACAPPVWKWNVESFFVLLNTLLRCWFLYMASRTQVGQMLARCTFSPFLLLPLMQEQVEFKDSCPCGRLPCDSRRVGQTGFFR